MRVDALIKKLTEVAEGTNLTVMLREKNELFVIGNIEQGEFIGDEFIAIEKREEEKDTVERFYITKESL